ncbi:hypothetical protein HBH92_241070 [Parastagonospora nodorum]|nr:hypothetical protein HBI02_219050 [Parastagonospora nodorum]KAH4327178.1 hypothetical protein HBI00_127200 [Parastagonospora nodorum]KAH4400055.1 hypothetical protein HBH92_241070 [Parastagonospora nodorum]KAH4409910.1 hypothetical protein HBH93_223320 [Parastagonospora nodorum]KAH4523819.1 hypothetical protein HBH85_239110 [Parastagonospora nodorum]
MLLKVYHCLIARIKMHNYKPITSDKDENSQSTDWFESRVPSDTRLDTSAKWDLLTSWAQRYHLSARTEIPDSFPSRFLDLSREGHVRLVDAVRAPYAALSHRWGASKHLITTTQNIGRLRAGVRVHHLPMMFQDAISVARHLRVHALWIDALCIVQDDEHDWEREAHKMGDIYTNSDFVIAAHCASDDSGGFLAESMSKREAVEIDLQNEGKRVGIYRRGNIDSDITSSLLSKRGWVLQERLLATHILHFTANGLFSERGSEVFSEDGTQEDMPAAAEGEKFWTPSAMPELQTALMSQEVKRETITRNESAQRQTPLDWLHLVEIYTNCDLTREEDKLFAIAGVAARIFARSNLSWCAGLWSDRISEGLLWLPGQNLTRPVNPRAPSWSWAAWDGSIHYPQNIHGDSFESKAAFLKVQGVYDTRFCGDEVWLAGPGTLQIRVKLFDLTTVIFTGDCVPLGPGPDRRGYFTNNNQDLPRVTLKKYLNVHTLHGRRAVNKRLKVREHRLPPCGWVALDDHQSAPRQDSDMESRSLQGRYFALLGIGRMSSGAVAYLGIFLCVMEKAKGHLEYYRIGCGQLSHSFISGEQLEYQPGRQDATGWSTDTEHVQIPLDLEDVSTITIR